MVRLLGLTGPIACGKSTVSALLAEGPEGARGGWGVGGLGGWGGGGVGVWGLGG